MKYLILLLAIIACTPLRAQIAFEENFDSLSTGLDLSTLVYQLSQGSDYVGTVALRVAENDSAKFARMEATPNGAAKMQWVLTIDVEPGKTYTYELESKGPFKRQLRVYSESDVLLAASGDYKPSTDQEISEWKKMEVSFIPDPGVKKLKIGFHHYWSGIMDIDNIKVYEITRQKAFYLSSSEGNDDNEGTINAPWLSLEKISATTLFPGDTVLFKRGDQFNGHYVVNGSGNEDLPVIITAYGEGERPIISGQVDSTGGGDYQEAILVENNDNLIFDGLDVQNERLASRSGVADTDAFGLHVKNTGDRIMRNLAFRNVHFKDVFAVQPILDPEDFNTIQVSGLNFSTSRNTEAGKEKHIRDVLVEDCYFANLQRFGIKFSHNGGNTGVGNDSINRNMNIVCRNNEFYYNGGTSILPSGTYNFLIENNIFDHPGASTDPRMPGRGSSVWNYNSINTIAQYNMCLSTRGYLDSYGIHIDHNNVNTFLQYNYMEDCEGGFVEILKGNKNAVYRFNVSVNSGWRKNETWENSNLTIWMSSARWTNTDGNLELSDSCYVYNNTVVINEPFTTAISMDAKNIFVYNNIFSSTNGSGMGSQQTVVRSNDTPFFMSNNLFDGTVDNRFVAMDAMPQNGSPMFVDTGEHKYVYQLQEGSLAIDNGATVQGPIVPGAGQGIFKDIPAYPNVDFYGNPIDLSSGTPNIGANNVKYEEEEDSTVNVMYARSPSENKWLIYPLPAESRIRIHSEAPISGALSVSLFKLNGQLIQTETKNLHSADYEYDLRLKTSLANGIYIIRIRNRGETHSRRFVYY